MLAAVKDWRYLQHQVNTRSRKYNGQAMALTIYLKPASTVVPRSLTACKSRTARTVFARSLTGP